MTGPAPLGPICAHHRRWVATAAAAVTLFVVVLTSLAGPLAGAAGATDASGSAGSAGAARARATEPGRVLIVTMPRLTWAAVREYRPTNLMKLLDRSAVAACSIRTAGSITRPGDAYLTLGAGNRMGTVVDVDGTVVERSEPLPEGDPSAVFQRLTGITPTAPIVAIGAPTVERYNDEEQYFGAKAGSLASALDGADRTMAVIANADQAFGLTTARHAGLAAMDTTGQVHDGLVSPELLRADDRASFGLSTDPDVVSSVFESTWSNDDVVLVEMSDLERAELARASATAEQGEKQFARALRTSDELLGRLLDRVDTARDTVIVLGPTPPLDENQLTVFAMAGPGIERGWASSGTTRRDGYVTLTDVAPWILDHYGIAVPDAMGDTPLAARADATPTAARIDDLVERNERAVVRDRAFGPITVVFIVAIVVDIALAIICLARVPALAAWVRGLALVVLAVPPVTYLVGLVPVGSPGLLGAVIVGGAVLAAVVAAVVGRTVAGGAPLFLLGLLWLVLAVDIATGGALQINTVFGYSPIVAGRFAGFGNQAFSMIALTALLLATAAVERRTPAGERAERSTLAVVAVAFVVTIVLDGAPSMGSDVGGVLAFVPAAALALLLFAGVRIRVRLVALIGVGTVALLSLFAGLDLARPADERTHLGRFVAKVFDGGAAEILQRKLAANLRVLTSVWAWVIPVALVYFMYLTWRPTRTLQRLFDRHPQFRSFGIAALTLGVLAMVLNDSGVSLPAMMVGIVATYVSYVVVRLDAPGPNEAPATPAPSATPAPAAPLDVGGEG